MESVVDTTCYEWTVSQIFEFSQRSVVNVRLNFDRYPCLSKDVITWDTYMWLQIAVLVTCTIHLLITVK